MHIHTLPAYMDDAHILALLDAITKAIKLRQPLHIHAAHVQETNMVTMQVVACAAALFEEKDTLFMVVDPSYAWIDACKNASINMCNLVKRPEVYLAPTNAV